MKVTDRRKQILEILENETGPVAANELAARFQVSRQVIVQDIAVIRARTPEIISTCRGYIMRQRDACMREIKVRHNKNDAVRELKIIVDCGGRVKNVSIKHRIYGRITAPMDIVSQKDIEEFISLLQGGKSTLLGSATAGYHYHLIEAVNSERLDLIEQKLAEAGLLAPFCAWEKKGKK